MTHTRGPWAYDADQHAIVSRTEHEEWSVAIPDEEPVRRRVISTYGAMGGDDTAADVALMATAPELLDVCDRLAAAAASTPGLAALAAEAAAVAAKARDPAATRL